PALGASHWRPPNTWEDPPMTPASTCRVMMLASLAAATLSSRNARATIGPTADADVYAIAIDPSAPWILYVGTTQGIYQTTDGGQSWSPSGEGVSGQIYSNMVVDPTDPQRLYLGTNGSGLYRSTDGGASWSHGEGSYHRTVKSIAIDPDQANVLSMGAFRDIYRSFDYGATWGPLHLAFTSATTAARPGIDVQGQTRGPHEKARKLLRCSADGPHSADRVGRQLQRDAHRWQHDHGLAGR